MRTTTENPLTSRNQELDLSALFNLPIEAVDQQMETPIQTWYSTPSPGSGRLSPLVEEPLDLETGPSSTPSSVRGRRQSNFPPHIASTRSTSSAPQASPSYPIPSAPQQFTADSSSLQSMPNTREEGARRRWSVMSYIRPRIILNTAPDVNGGPSSPSTPNSDTLHVQKRAPQVKSSTRSRAQTAPTRVPNAEAPQISQPATLLVPLPRSRRRQPLSQVVLEFMEKVANDSENLVRHPADGSVSAGNLEDLISRVITDTADPSEDSRLRHAFLTVYQLFTTSERLFEILKRRFRSMELDPRAAHILSRFK
jgi:RasGEF N-terminal motif